MLLFEHLAQDDEPLVFGTDETLELRRGSRINAKGVFRDAVRSSESHLVRASELRWVSLMWLTHIPWALPVLTALVPAESYHQKYFERAMNRLKHLTALTVAIGVMTLAACGEAASLEPDNAPYLSATVETSVQATLAAQPNTPATYSTYYDMGVEHIKEEEYEQAIDSFSKAIELNPDYANAYSRRGIIYASKADYVKAFADFDKAIELNSNFADAYFGRGLIYLNIENYDNAIADFSRVLELNPSSTDAYIARGLVYNSKGDYDKAIADFDKAIAIEPNNTIAKEARELGYASQRTAGLSVWSCEHLAELIEQLSEEKASGTLRPEILKIYDIRETSRSPIRVECLGFARLSVGYDTDIIFHIEKDDDGDVFYGYELE